MPFRDEGDIIYTTRPNLIRVNQPLTPLLLCLFILEYSQASSDGYHIAIKMPGLECFCISFHNPSCQQLPLFNQDPYCSLPSSNFQLSQVTMDGRERQQLNFNFVLPLRKYTKEVALGCLANGGMTTHQSEVWSLPSSHPRWDAVGQEKDWYPEAFDEEQRKGPWL